MILFQVMAVSYSLLNSVLIAAWLTRLSGKGRHITAVCGISCFSSLLKEEKLPQELQPYYYTHTGL